MIKRLIASILAVAAMLGMMGVVNAASPVTFAGQEKVEFDIDLGGQSASALSASGYNLNGNWDYNNYYMISPGSSGNAKITKTLNLSDATSYVFKTETINLYNGIVIKLGWDDTAKTGYQIFVPSSKKAYLFKDMEYNMDGTGAVAVSTETKNVYSMKSATTVTVNGNTLTATLRNGDTLTYTADSKTGFNGEFGVESAATANFTVFNMSLVSAKENIVVDTWKYEKTFSATDTQAQLAKDGVTFTDYSGYTTDAYGNKGMGVGGSNITSFAPNGGVLSGDYTFETAFTKQYNSYNVEFNYIDENNYYAIKMDGNSETPSLIKKSAGTETVLRTGQAGTDPGLDTWRVKAEYKISVAETDAGLVINATVTGNTQTQTFTYTDTEPLATRGICRINQWGPTGPSILHYLNAYSTPSNATVGTVDTTLIDKAFVTGDTQESLAQQDIILSKAPISIITPPDKTEYGKVYERGEKYTADTSSTKQYGLFTGKDVEVTYNKNLSGDYTIESTFKVQYNQADMYLNYVDNKNYYQLKFQASSGLVWLTKKVNGVSYTMANGTKEGTVTEGFNFNGRGCTHTIKVTDLGTGGLKFDITGVTEPWTDRKATYSFTDDGTTYGAVVRDGKFKVKLWTDCAAIYDLKIVEHEEIKDNAEFKGVFYNGNAPIGNFQKGDIYFDMPTALMGDYKMIAALYENHKMTEIKTFEPKDLYDGKVQLFDTSACGDNAVIKVFFVDASNTLNKKTETWVLQ